MSVFDKVPTVELMMGDSTQGLVLRHLAPLTPTDEENLLKFGKKHQISIWTQSGGLDSIDFKYNAETDAAVDRVSGRPLSPASYRTPLFYTLPKHKVAVHFYPSDFIQVNAQVNQLMVDMAIEFLELDKTKDNVVDLFCGLGNFTLPISRYANTVAGIEVPSVSSSR